MEPYLFISLIAIVIILFSIVRSNASQKRKVFKNNAYSYTAKSSVMTRAEAEFFITLDRAVRDRYHVFPQMHLSAILDHHVGNQDWKYAFRHINGKSVDYVLCDKNTFQPTYAIELDDYTHDKSDRKTRDAEVERIMHEAGLPLIRFKNKNASANEIIDALVAAYNR